MPIEPIQPIHQIWNPLQAAGPLLQMQQLGMERQRLDLMDKKVQLDAAEMIAKNPDIPITTRYGAVQTVLGFYGVKTNPGEYQEHEALYTALLTTAHEKGPDAPETVAIGNKLYEVSPMFRKQAEGSLQAERKQKALQGVSEMGGAVRGGEPLNAAQSEATLQMPTLQKPLGEAYYQTPLERQKAALVQERLDTIQLEENLVSSRQSNMVQLTNPSFSNLDNEIQYRKSLPLSSVEDTGHEDPLRDLGRKQLDNENRAIEAGTLTKSERMAAAQRVQQDLVGLNQARHQLQSQIRDANALAGTKQAVSIDALESQLEAVNEAVKLKSAELPYLNNALSPNAFSTMKAAYADYAAKLQANKARIAELQQQRLDIGNASLDEKKLEYRTGQLYQGRLIQAGGEFGTGPMTPQRAAALGVKYNVKPEDILKGAKNPNEPLVKIAMSEETAESKKVGEGFGEQFIELQKSGVAAVSTISKLNRMEQLTAGVATGKLSPAIAQVQALGQSLGFEVDKTLPAKQALESLTGEIALGLRNPSGGAGMPGALSDKDLEFLRSMPPGLNKTPGGNALIIKTARTLAERSQEVARMARAYRVKNGHFDEGFLDELQTYSAAHPLFKGQSVQEAVAESTVAPFDDTEKERRYQEFKRKHQ